MPSAKKGPNMTSTSTLHQRNQEFSANFTAENLPILPRLRTVILACGDSRVDPAHILGLELGDAVVIRNNGARVTTEVLHEIAALAFLVAKMDGDTPGPFEVVIVQHTQCGAERFADPGLQQALKSHLGIDVSPSAITDHHLSLKEDIEKLRQAPEVPPHVIVSGHIYDVKTGKLEEAVAPRNARPH